MSLPKRKPNRLPRFDYGTVGAYFITICAREKKKVFGRVVGGGGAAAPPRAPGPPRGQNLKPLGGRPPRRPARVTVAARGNRHCAVGGHDKFLPGFTNRKVRRYAESHSFHCCSHARPVRGVEDAAPYRGACQPNHSGIRFHAQAHDKPHRRRAIMAARLLRPHHPRPARL